MRPASPLTLFLGVAFILLLLSILSTPIIKAIPLGRDQDVTFGVFGYCKAGGCSDIRLGYGNVDSIIPGDAQAFDFSPSARSTISSILVLHPVAAALTLVVFLMAAAAHTRSAAHSSRYLLVLLVLLFIDTLVCIAAFVVDLLLFLPHQAWGTYIVLASAILVFLSTLASFFVRRNLIRRKSYKIKGGSYLEASHDGLNLANLASKPGFAGSPQPTVPVISGANSPPDSLPAFATFDHKNRDDEQIPLTQRTRSDASIPSAHKVLEEIGAHDAVGVALGSPNRILPQIPHDSGPASPTAVHPAGGGWPHGSIRGGWRGADSAMNHGGHNGAYTPPYMRGRGGFGPPGGPSYGPRGGRAGYGGPARGSFGRGGMMMRSGGRSPPPSHNPAASPYGRRPYAELPSANQVARSPAGVTKNYTAYHPDFSLPRSPSTTPLPEGLPASISGSTLLSRPNAEFVDPQASSPAVAESTGSPDLSRPRDEPAGSPVSIHPIVEVVDQMEPVEMDATPASISTPSPPHGHSSDSDEATSSDRNPREIRMPIQTEQSAAAEDSYSDDQYMPARAAWSQSPLARAPRIGSPTTNLYRAISNPSVGGASSTRKASGDYYEDVDPRFDQTHTFPLTYQQSSQRTESDGDERRDRSPAESDRSNFTSVSQRGVNPKWSPLPPVPQSAPGAPPRQPGQQRHDPFFGNPDFMIPAGRRSGASSQMGSGGMTPGSAYPTGPL